MTSKEKELKDSIDEAEWVWIKPHIARGAVILVPLSLTILEVGVAVAENNHSKVQEWIEKGLLTKPTREQIESWDLQPAQKFVTLIVQPYVFIQIHF